MHASPSAMRGAEARVLANADAGDAALSESSNEIEAELCSHVLICRERAAREFRQPHRRAERFRTKNVPETRTAMRLRLVLALTACAVGGAAAWVPVAACYPIRPQIARAEPRMLSEEQAQACDMSVRLKTTILHEQGRRAIERRERMRKRTDAELKLVKKRGGVSGTPGIMMAPPGLAP